MPIKPNCDCCQNALEEFGDISLSPPDEEQKVVKLHRCINCYEEVLAQIKTRYAKN
ncbi:hypothetical protein GF380_02000 [Candidatus Uhrbacteria bacterium]|nr:hypothetical protein [Candidatus Uhrbacteria bacterium]